MRAGGSGFPAGLALAAACFLLSGCVRTDPRTLDPAGEARRTFESARVMLRVRGALVEGRMQDVRERLARLGERRAIVVFAHGCAGLRRGNLRYVRLLARAGYAVVAPDSFARLDRPETCVPSRRRPIRGAPHGRVARMRQEEIRHAARRLRELPWADAKNLFLMGQSQGGTAAAAYEGEEFRARVIAGSTCARGVGAAPGAPALALYSKDDPWRRGRPADRCLREARERGVSLEFHLFEGSAHNFSRNGAARRLILDFLARHRVAE